MTEPRIIWLREGLSKMLGDRSFNVKGGEPYIEAQPVAELLERLMATEGATDGKTWDRLYEDGKALLAALREHESPK